MALKMGTNTSAEQRELSCQTKLSLNAHKLNSVSFISIQTYIVWPFLIWQFILWLANAFFKVDFSFLGYYSKFS